VRDLLKFVSQFPELRCDGRYPFFGMDFVAGNSNKLLKLGFELWK
jgi:hypothetical protein